MHTTSPRCLGRALGRRGVQPIPSTHARAASYATSTTGRNRRVSASSASATSTPAIQGWRRYAAGVQPPGSIAVLGGGLTGLSTAWYLTRLLPQANITLYEASNRLGGWIDTETVEVQTEDGQKGTVNFERAARMIAPQTKTSNPKWDDLVFFDMVANLNLADQLEHSTGSEQPVSGYLYYPDHLVAIPRTTMAPFTAPLETLRSLGALVGLMTEAPFRGLVPAIFNFLGTKSNPYDAEMFKGQRDMSVGEYFAYRLGGPDLVDKAMSAMIHGITGGDIWKLSMVNGPFADTLLRHSDLPITRVLTRPADFEMMRQLAKDKKTYNLAKRYLHANAIWFRKGFSTLPNALADALRSNPNVTIKTGDPVNSIRYHDGSDSIFITTDKSNKPLPYDKVVSTIFAKKLASLTDGHLPSLEKSTAVTIHLVNLWYPQPFLNHPHYGFGYLVPQAISFDRNPECVLGVIFDSDREWAPPWSDPTTATTTSRTGSPNRGADTIHGTKLTVMLGGHYWDGLPDGFLPDDDAAAIDMAEAAVQRHLGWPDDGEPRQHRPVAASAKRCVDCIPQHVVGHAARMRAAHGELQWAFKGRLAVAGQSYQPPGVLPALRAGRDVAVQIAGAAGRGRQAAAAAAGEGEGGGLDESGLDVGDTGLARFCRTDYAVVEKASCPLRYGSQAWVDENGNVRLNREACGESREVEEK